MATETVNDLLSRARTDGVFYQALQAEPTRALEGYDLTQDERLALMRRDRAALLDLGVPIELVEWFAVQD
jgi:hypothetical protein